MNTPGIRAPMGILALVIALLAGAGCASNQPQAQWVHEKVEAASERVLWDVTFLALEKTGFPLGARIDPAQLRATSGWHISLAPFRRKGFREQCEVRYTPAGVRKYTIEVRVKREINDDIVRPLDLTYAEWEPEPDNPERAHVVLQYIKALLGSDFKVGEPRKAP